LHGDDDQIVPIADSALLSAKIVKNAALKVYNGAPHGMPATHKDQINADLLAFFREGEAGGGVSAAVDGGRRNGHSPDCRCPTPAG
jgi:hypothetical protein